MTPTLHSIREKQAEERCKVLSESGGIPLQQVNFIWEQAFDAAVALVRDREVRPMKDALVKLNQHLTVPAAEYVPAIPEAWKLIEDALRAQEARERE